MITPIPANQQEIMFNHIKQWQLSGLNKNAYCTRTGISKDSFYYWYSKFTRHSQNTTTEFIPVKIAPKEAIKETFEIKYPNQIKIQLPTTASLELIHKLLTAI